MYGISTVMILIIQTLGSLYTFIVLLRFLLQWARADFYNPISQFMVRATQPLLQPLRRIIPGFAGVDLASLVLAWLLQYAMMLGVIGLNSGLTPFIVFSGGTLGTALARLALWALISTAALLLKIIFFALIVSVILSWVAPDSRSPGAQLINQLCEPVLTPFRRLLPALGGLDLSPILAFLTLQIIQLVVIANLSVRTGMALVFGQPGLFF